jgi:hypothetical protein
VSLDDEQRALERSARVDSRVADFLTCLREGHVPASGIAQGGSDAGRAVVVRGVLAVERVRQSTGEQVVAFPAEAGFCDRCGLLYARPRFGR